MLEFARLYGIAAQLKTSSPGLERHLWLRSALVDRAPFGRLPVDSISELPAGGGPELPAALMSRLREPRSACFLIGADPALERRLTDSGIRLAGVEALDFRIGHPESAGARAASDAFFDAICRASPRWVGAAGHRQGGPLGPTPRLLVHQSRSHVGDTLWVTPLLRAIRSRFADAQVTVAGPPVLNRLLSASPDVDDLLVYDPKAGDRERARVRHEIAARDFDATLFAFTRRPKSRWLAEAAAECGVERRINLEYFDGADDGREPSDLFTVEGWFFWGTMASPRLLMHALCPLVAEPEAAESAWLADRTVRFAPDEASRNEADRLLLGSGIGERPFVVLTPGGESSERWPAERFAELAVRCAAELDLDVLVEGAGDETELLAHVGRRVEELAAVPRAASDRIRVRQDSLGVLAALLERATLLVSNDSAPIHLAEACGTPTLYFAQHEKLTHSHPAGARQLALFDGLDNRVGNITTDQALGAASWVLERE